MTDELTLIKANPLLPVEDFSFLKREGIDYIEKLAGDIWTEYNPSDPGITILEAVNYAITDLSYRTSFDMKDLLTPNELSKDMWNKIFYTARQILHSNPVTINDWRKVIIDIEGVRNAWVETSKDYEVPIYVEYDWVQAKKNCEGKSCFGFLTINSDSTKMKEKLKDDKQGMSFSDTFDALKTAITAKVKEIIDLWVTPAAADKAKYNADLKEISLQLAKMVYNGQKKEDIINQIDKYYPILFKVNNEAEAADLKKKISDLIDYFKDEIGVALGYLALGTDTNKILEINGLYNVTIEYEEYIVEEKHREEVRDKVVGKIHSHRNLCEDFLSVNEVDSDKFTAAGLIVLKENAEPDEVLAQIAFAIYRYFSPRVGFYTIDQLMNKGYSVEEIFEEPALHHGFIETSELENTDFFRDLRLSDIINLLSDIEGIEAIPNFYIPKEAANDSDKDVSIYFDRWIKQLQAERKVARFDLPNSSFTFLKKNSVTTYNTGKTADRRIDRPNKRFEDLKTQDQAYKLKGYANDFPIMVGENMEIEDYYPIQYSLPKIYGVDEHEVLPKNPTDQRTIQAYQLKGYLQFFEQILSNYHAQLNHLNAIFSFDENVEETYYVHLLREINNFKELILDYDPIAGEMDEHVFSEFSKIIHQLIEPKNLFYQRRNTFLNHLLARFDEDLSEYEALTRYLWKEETDKKLISDKIKLLQDYIKVSSQRGKGFNYAETEELWNTDNISGAERRIGRLLGFSTINRHSLTPTNLITEAVMIKNSKGDMVQKKNPKGELLIVVKLINEKEEVLLTSTETKEGSCCIDEFMNLILQQAEIRKNYYLHDRIKGIQRSKQKEQTGIFTFDLMDEEGYIIAKSNEYTSRNSRNEAIEAIIKLVNDINENEGMHLVEHILLRPKLDSVLPYADYTPPYNNQDVPVEDVELLKICLDECDLNKGVDEVVDEYKYRVRISRIPAEKCYNNEPWVLEILNLTNESILFKNVYIDKDEKEIRELLTFRRYDVMNKRLADLREFGSDPDNYLIETYTNNIADAAGKEDIQYSYKIVNEESEVLAQTRFYDTLLEAQKERDDLVKYFSYQLDLYCDEDPCDNNEDPYSFRVTIVLPCWVKRFRNQDYQYFVEKTIQSEVPAHIHARIKWVGISQMKIFEDKYYAWLDEFMSNPYPEYEPVNELVKVLNNISECGDCEDDCRSNTEKPTPDYKM